MPNVVCSSAWKQADSDLGGSSGNLGPVCQWASPPFPPGLWDLRHSKALLKCQHLKKKQLGAWARAGLLGDGVMRLKLWTLNSLESREKPEQALTSPYLKHGFSPSLCLVATVGQLREARMLNEWVIVARCSPGRKEQEFPHKK